MMVTKIESAGMGVEEMDENEMIVIPQGLPGFPEYERYALIKIEDMPFFYLQSMDNESLAFVVADPFSFFPAYEFDMSESDLEELQVSSVESLMVFGIITLTENIDLSTMNLVAPVIINADKKLGKQTILTSSTYTTKHRIFQGSHE